MAREPWYLEEDIFPRKKKNEVDTPQDRNDFKIPSKVAETEELRAQGDTPQTKEGGWDWGDFGSSLAKHGISSATMGLAEFSDTFKTDPWADKSAGELWGSAIGEALGFLVPVGAIGKGVRAGKSLIGQGSKRLAKQAARESADLAGKVISKSAAKAAGEGIETISEKGAEELIERAIKHESGAHSWQIFGSRANKLYRYEIGGEALAKAELDLGARVSERIGVELKEAGIKGVSQSQVDDIVTGYLKSLAEGKHYNTFAAGMERFMVAPPATGILRTKIGKWAAQAADEFVILGADGVMRDYIRSKTTAGDEVPHEFAPGTAAGHSAILSALFPAIRSGFGIPFFKGGGKEKIGQGASILFSKWKSVDYAPKALTAHGRAELKGLLNIMRGNKQATEFANVPIRINGKEMFLDDVLNMNLNTEKGGKIAVQALNQIRSQMSTATAMKKWAGAYGVDAIKSMPRMALGAFAMNQSVLMDPMLRDMDPNEIIPHLLIAGLMTKGRKGWMEGEMASRYSQDYMSTLRMLNINPDGLGKVVNYYNKRQLSAIQSRGLLGSSSANEIFDIFDTEYRNAKNNNNRRRKDSIPAKYREVKNWYDAYHRKGIVEDLDFEVMDLNYLTDAQLSIIDSKLRSMDYKGKKLTDHTPVEWFNIERIESNKGVEQSHIQFLKTLSDLGVIETNPNPETGKLDVSRPEVKGKDAEFNALDRMIIRLEKLGLINIRNEWGKPPSEISTEALRETIDQFKGGIEADIVGENIHLAWDIDKNLFLDEMLAVRKTQTGETLQKIVHEDPTGLTEIQAAFKADAVDPYLLDDTGRIVRPTDILVIPKEQSEEGKAKTTPEDKRMHERKREDLEDRLREMSSVFFFGAAEKSTSGQKVKVAYEQAEAILDQFEALQLPISSKILYENKMLSTVYANEIKSRRYDKMNLKNDPLMLDMVTDLEDSGLGWLNQEEGIYYMYDYKTALMKADQGTSTKIEQEQYATIVNYLGNKVQVRGDVIRDLDKEVDLTAIERIHSKIPEIRDRMVNDIIDNVVEGKMYDVDLDSGKEVINTLRDALVEGDAVKARQALEEIAVVLPVLKEHIDKISNHIEKNAKEGARLDEIFETASATDPANWIDVVTEALASEQYARTKGEETLKWMLTERNNSLFYIKNITRELERSLKREGESLEDLAQEFIRTQGFQAFRRLLNGAYFSRPKDLPRSEQYYESELDQFNRTVKSDQGNKSRSIVEILDDYGFKEEGTNDIKQSILEALKTDQGISDLVADLANESVPAADRFLRRDLNKLLHHYDIQKKVTRATLKDNKLVFEFDVAVSQTRDYDIYNEMRETDGIVIFELSGQALDNGVKPIELVSELNKRIRGAEPILDHKDDLRSFGINEELQDWSIDATESRLAEIQGKKFEVLITGYSKPKIFSIEQENITKINTAFQKNLQSVLANAPTESIRQNVEKAFTTLSDAATQLRFMHWFKTNGALGYELFTNENMSDISGGAFSKVARKYVKYSTLFANDLSKPVSKELLKSVLDKNKGMDTDVREAMVNIYNKFDKIGVAAVGDEIFSEDFRDETNFFNLRKRHIDQIQADYEIGGITEAQYKTMIEKYSITGKDGLFPSLDNSAWDGIIVISRDMYLASLGMGADGVDINALKPAMWHNTGLSTLLGKGMYVYIPEISDQLDARGIQMLMAGSAIKSLRGKSRNGTDMQSAEENKGIMSATFPRNSIKGMLEVMNDNNIMDISFSDQGIIKTGHGLNKAPISHTLTYGATNDGVKDIRVWMQLDKTIENAIEADNLMKRSASTNLAKTLLLLEAEGGFESENLGQVRDMVRLYNFHHTHPLVRKSIFRIFKDRMLGKLNKPTAAGKQGRYYIYPDTALSNPYYTTVKNSEGRSIEVQTQMGEVDIPYEYVEGKIDGLPLRPVHSMNELQFSYREGGIDYLVEYKDGKLTVEDNLSTYAGHGYDILPTYATVDARGKPITERMVHTPAAVPEGLVKVLDNMKAVMESSQGKVVLGDGTGFTFGRIAATFNQLTIDHGVDANLLTMIERGPRKGISDFQMVKVRRVLPKEYGPMLAVNGYDVRVGLQGDWDGDAVNLFYGMPGSKVRAALNDAGIIPDYPTTTGTPFELNPFGIDFNTGVAGLTSHGSIESYMEKTKSGEIAMGKVIGLNNALSWALNTKFRILDANGQEMSMNAGLELADKIAYSDRFAHFGQSAQTIVDFATNPNKAMLKDPIKEIFFADGLELIGSKGEATAIDRQITEIVFDVMRKPARLFNNITDRSGKHKPRVDELEGLHNDLRNFFYDPNTYILTELIRRNRKNDTEIAKIIARFYDTKGLENASDYAEFVKKVRKRNYFNKRILPIKQVVSFGEEFIGKNSKEGIDVSDSGYLLRQISEHHMFNDRGFIEAWDISSKGKEVSRYANMIMSAEQNFQLARMLGETEHFDMRDFNEIFGMEQLAKSKDYNRAEHLAKLETALNYEFERAKGSLGRIEGQRFANEYDLQKAEDRVMSLARASDFLELKIKEAGLPKSMLQKTKIITVGSMKEGKEDGLQVLARATGDTGYSYFYKIKNKSFIVRDENGDITDVDYNAVSRDPIIVAEGKSVKYTKHGQRVRGQYIELKNPLVGKRLSDADTQTGYMMYLFTKNNPLTFLFPDIGFGRTNLEKGTGQHIGIVDVRRGISDSWRDTIRRLKEGAEYKDELFTLNEAETADLLRRYYTDNAKSMIDAETMKELQLDIQDLSAKEAEIYFLTKALLTPTPMARMYVKNDSGAAPYFYINRTLIDKTMSYLYKNHQEVWNIIHEDLGNVWAFMTNHAEAYESVPDKSPMYTGRRIIGAENVPSIAERPNAVLRFGITPDLGMQMKERGIMSLGEVETDAAGVGYRKIQSIIGKMQTWEDTKAGTCY